MIFRKALILAASAFVLCTAPFALEQARAEGRLIVENEGALNAYLKGLETARLQLDGACELLRGASRPAGKSASITLSLDGEKPEIRGLERLGIGEQVLARTSLRVIRALARLGLTAPEGRFTLRLEEAGLYIGSETKGGRVFADPCVGLGHLLKLIIDASTQAPASLRTAARASGSTALLDRLRGSAQAIALLSRGAIGKARIEALTSNGQNFDFSGTPGITVTGIKHHEDQSVELTLAVDPQSPIGDGAVYAYDPANRFTPISKFPVRIVEAPAEQSPARPPPPALSPGRSVRDVLQVNGETRAFMVAIERPGLLVIESSGSVDLAAGLTSPSGQVLASNDDGGKNYNFRLEQAVEPGQYRLDVTHCCGGAGAYGITVKLQ